MTNEIFLIILLLIFNIFFFLIGFIIGRIWSTGGVYHTKESSPVSFFKENKQTKKQINIDDTKYVVDIKTTDLEKKYNNLGETKISKENIDESVNKLKNMKK